jgi:nucleoside phosphorylase/tetratricopeptide (TPR) repeat protein
MPSRTRIQFVHSLQPARDYQDRPECAHLCDWWRAGQVGLCALIGLGGAGKTALADRFLRLLPGIMPPQATLPKDDTLVTPEGLFVTSFYSSASPETFFAKLAAWLRRKPYNATAQPPSYHETLDLLWDAPCLLLVLDGFERVQADGTRGDPVGLIQDGSLRDFLLRTANGEFRNLAVLITTRFRLFEPLAKGSPHYLPISVERLTCDAAVALLRARGVTGPEEELRQLAADQGYHALTIDLMGGFIARFCGGDPLRLPAAPLGRISDQTGPEASRDPEAAAVREQEARFARLTARYREALAANDPAALALLERISLFRMPVDAGTIAKIFTGGGKGQIAGPLLAALESAGMRSKLDLLVEMRLLEADNGGYTAHPAVRDEFRRGLGKATAWAGHLAAGLTLAATLSGLPGEGVHPSDPGTLDLLEEVIHHMLAAGRRADAWHLYSRRLGRYPHLGGRLGASGRGERICRLFAGGRSARLAPRPRFMSENVQALFLNEWALYLRHLGKLEEAQTCFQQNLMIRSQANDPRRSIGLENYSDLLLLQGKLEQARRAGRESQLLLEQPAAYSPSHNHAVALSGRTDEALALYEQVRQSSSKNNGLFEAVFGPTSLSSARTLHDAQGLYRAQFLARLGKRDIAIQALRSTRAWSEAMRESIQLALAEILLQEGSGAEASELWRGVRDWAVAHDARDLLCRAALVGSRFALAEALRTPAVDGADATRWLSVARQQVEEGLHVARECGFGLVHIDLLTVRARIALVAGLPEAAERDARTALFGGTTCDGPPNDESTAADQRGIFPPRSTGFPLLLAATHPACGYAWGEVEGRHLWAEALLLQAAQALGRPQVDRSARKKVPIAVQAQIDAAARQFNACIALRERMHDPRHTESHQLLRDLEEGVLTRSTVARQTEKIAAEPEFTSSRRPSSRHSATRGREQVLRADKALLAADEPTIGIITALEHEYAAMQAVLPPGREITMGGEGAGRRYWATVVPGSDGKRHPIVLGIMLAMGNDMATGRATDLISHFPRVRSIIMAGIAGGIPYPEKPDEHVRLGDAVVSGERGVIQYDMVKETATIKEGRSSPRPPSPELLEAVKLLRAAELQGQRPWEHHLATVLKALGWKRPSARSDVLVATQNPAQRIEHPADPERRGKKLRVFRGPIASANVLLKDPVKRDALRDQFRVKAVEMEGAGIADTTWAHERGYLVVRGICDYCDSNKGDAWQQYAAAVAAAYTRALLESMPGSLPG